MDIGYILFWTVFSIVVGVLYYRFAIRKDTWLNKLIERLAHILEARKAFLLSHGQFILGIALIGIFQYNLSTLAPLPSFTIGQPIFSSVQPMIDLSTVGIPDPITTLFNYLMLLAGCFLLVSALKGFDAVPNKQGAVLLSGNNPGVSKGHPILVTIFGFILVFYLLWQLYNQSKEPYLIGVWLVAIMIFGYLAAQADFHNGVFLGPHIRRSDLIWLAALFLLGLIIGMYRLQSLPGQFVGDEGSFWDLASKIASGTVRPLFFDNGVYSFPNLSSIAQATILMIFGVSVWSWRFSSLLAGLLTVIPLYLLARELFGRQVAVVSCLLMVTLEYFLAFSRLGYNNSQALFPVTLALYFVVMSIKRNSILYFYLAGCAAGLGFYTYSASRSGLVIIALVMLTFLLQNRQANKNIFQAMVVLSLGWFVFASPLLVFSSVHSPGSGTVKLEESVFFRTDFADPVYLREEIIKDPGTILSSDGVYFFNLSIYINLIMRGFIRTFLSFNVAAGLIREHFITAPLAGIAGAAFFTIGMFISLVQFRKLGHYLLLYWFAVNIILLSALNTAPPRHQHMVSVIPLIALWTSLGLVSTVNGLSHLYFHNHKLRLILATTLTIGVAITGLYSYFVKMPMLYRPDREQVMSWAALYAQDEKIIYVYTKPEESHLKPYVMQFIRRDFPYSAIPLTELATKLNGKTMVFFPPNVAHQVKLILQSNWPEIRVQRTFYNAEGNQILEGATNFYTDFGAPPGLAAYLNDSYLRPGLWLVVLVIIFLVFAIQFRPAWIEHSPGWVKRAYRWITSEPLV